MTEDDEQRPRARGHFIEPDEVTLPLLIALGHLVLGAAGLEKTLHLELARVHLERAQASGDPEGYNLQRDLAKVERLTGGQAREELARLLDLPPELDARIASAVERRNALLHRPLEDVGLVRAVGTGEGLDEVVERVKRIAADCAELAVELERFAGDKLEGLLGKSRAELATFARGMDPSKFADPHTRAQLEALQAAGHLPAPPFELEPGE
ncbi:MAG: hypothetical protein ABSG95_11105 [Solirubrobacteraceae bacterium]|jgi:hypothetical protein